MKSIESCSLMLGDARRPIGVQSWFCFLYWPGRVFQRLNDTDCSCRFKCHNYLADAEGGQPKSRFEVLAEQRDYKRRRQSYRAKNVHITKRSAVEVRLTHLPTHPPFGVIRHLHHPCESSRKQAFSNVLVEPHRRLCLLNASKSSLISFHLLYFNSGF